MFVPEAFLKQLSCHYLKYGHNESPFVSFSIDNVLPNSFMVENEHGNVVVKASNAIQKADAHIIAGTHIEIAKLSHKHLAIKTADCLPIVFVYTDQNYFLGGITHAGWRGLTTQIITNTVKKLKTEATLIKIPENIFLQKLKVFIGPAIFGVSYECGSDVQKALNKHKEILFKNEENEFQELFNLCANIKNDPILAQSIHFMTSTNTIFPDLQLLAAIECASLKILPENISIFRTNTYEHRELPSFRASCHAAKPEQNKRLWTHLNLKIHSTKINSISPIEY